MEILATLQPCECFFFLSISLSLSVIDIGGDYFCSNQLILLWILHVMYWNTLVSQMDMIPNPSKEQLIDVVQRHFMSQVLANFLSFYSNNKHVLHNYLSACLVQVFMLSRNHKLNSHITMFIRANYITPTHWSDSNFINEKNCQFMILGKHNGTQTKHALNVRATSMLFTSETSILMNKVWDFEVVIQIVALLTQLFVWALVKNMDELQVIVGFVQAAKRLKKVCKWPLERWGKTERWLHFVVDALTDTGTKKKKKCPPPSQRYNLAVRYVTLGIVHACFLGYVW